MDIANKLTEISAQTYTRLSQAAVYSDVDCVDLIKQADLDYDACTPSVVDAWLADKLDAWEFERAPLYVYADFLVIASIEIASGTPIVSETLMLSILKAMVYYGNYHQVIELAQTRIDTCQEFYTLVKHIGKAYKSLGSYQRALTYYREALTKAVSEQNNHRTAFFMVLIGKLCDDYYQKKGMRNLYYHHLTRAHNIKIRNGLPTLCSKRRPNGQRAALLRGRMKGGGAVATAGLT